MLGTRTLNIAVLAIMLAAVAGVVIIVFGGGGAERLDWEGEFVPALIGGEVRRIEVGDGSVLKVQLEGDDTPYEVRLPEGTTFDSLVRFFDLTTESGIEVVGYDLPTPVPTPEPQETPAAEPEAE